MPTPEENYREWLRLAPPFLLDEQATADARVSIIFGPICADPAQTESVQAAPAQPRPAPLWTRIRGIIRADDESGARNLWLAAPGGQRDRLADVFHRHGVFHECDHASCYGPAPHVLQDASGDVSLHVCADHVGEYYTCDDCDRTDVYVEDVRESPRGGRTYCPDCYHERYTECTECGDTVSRNDTDAGGVCGDCRARHEEEEIEDGLLPYDSNPLNFLEFHDAAGDAVNRRHHIAYRYPVYGLELELEAEDRAGAMQRIRDAVGAGYCVFKRDGSLNDEEGFELVSAPGPLAYHADRLRHFPRVSGMTSHTSGNCGIHVHVSRRALSPLQIGKILVFINAPHNVRFVELIAQRTSERWAKIQPKTWADVRDGYGLTRYEAVNTTRRDTIEFRIFRGNTRRERILKCLEFVDAVVRWTAPGESSAARLTHEEFTAYVAKRGKDWPHLVAYLREKDVLPPAPIVKKPAALSVA